MRKFHTGNGNSAKNSNPPTYDIEGSGIGALRHNEPFFNQKRYSCRDGVEIATPLSNGGGFLVTKSKGVDPQLIHPSDPDLQLNDTIYGESPEADRNLENGQTKRQSEEQKKHFVIEKPKKEYLYDRRRPSGAASHCSIIDQRAHRMQKDNEKNVGIK